MKKLYPYKGAGFCTVSALLLAIAEPKAGAVTVTDALLNAIAEVESRNGKDPKCGGNIWQLEDTAIFSVYWWRVALCTASGEAWTEPKLTAMLDIGRASREEQAGVARDFLLLINESVYRLTGRNATLDETLACWNLCGENAKRIVSRRIPAQVRQYIGKVKRAMSEK